MIHHTFGAFRAAISTIVAHPVATSAIVVGAGVIGTAYVVKEIVSAYRTGEARSLRDPVVGLDGPAVEAAPAFWRAVPEVDLVMPGVPAPEDSRCRKAGRAVGAMIRREMGYPNYTTANRVVASQRIEAQRKRDYPSMRVSHAEVFCSHALHWVFTPSQVEERMHNRLHTAAEAEARRVPLGRYDYKASVLLRVLPEWIMDKEWAQYFARRFGLAPFVGPGFQ